MRSDLLLRNAVLRSFSFIIFFTSLMALSTFAQESSVLDRSKNNHEISLGVADLFFAQPVYYPYYAMDMMYYPYPEYNYDMPKVTLKYKYSFGKVAIRAGFDFAYRNEENENDWNELENETSDLYTLNKLGIEWQHNINKVQLFMGIDLYTQYSHYKYSYDTYYYIWDDSTGDYIEQDLTSETNNTETELGISPFIGIKLFINDNFSIATETNYMIGSYNNEYKYTYVEETTNTSEGTFARFGQIGIISFNVHF